MASRSTGPGPGPWVPAHHLEMLYLVSVQDIDNPDALAPINTAPGGEIKVIKPDHIDHRDHIGSYCTASKTTTHLKETKSRESKYVWLHSTVLLLICHLPFFKNLFIATPHLVGTLLKRQEEWWIPNVAETHYRLKDQMPQCPSYFILPSYHLTTSLSYHLTKLHFKPLSHFAFNHLKTAFSAISPSSLIVQGPLA